MLLIKHQLPTFTERLTMSSDFLSSAKGEEHYQEVLQIAEQEWKQMPNLRNSNIPSFGVASLPSFGTRQWTDLDYLWSFLEQHFCNVV